MHPTLIYCYDAYCGWCYGFSPVMRKICSEYEGILDVEVLSGGMILPSRPVHISATADHILKTYRTIEERTGVSFGADYLWHINHPAESDWYPDSLKPAIALCIFKEYFPLQQVAFCSDLQYALHGEGRDLCDDEAYRHLLLKYGIPEIEFYEKLHSEEYAEKARYEFALVKQLKVSGFPCLMLQLSATKFYLLSAGYTGYVALRQTLEAVLKETSIVK